MRLKSGRRFPVRLPWVAKYAPTAEDGNAPQPNADFYGYLLQRQVLEEGYPVGGKLPLILLHLSQPLLLVTKRNYLPHPLNAVHHVSVDFALAAGVSATPPGPTSC